MYFFSSKTFGPLLGPTQPAVELVLGAFTLGAKRPEREAEHLPQSNGEVKNKWSCTSTPSMCFYSARGQLQPFTFTTAHPLTCRKLDEPTQCPPLLFSIAILLLYFPVRLGLPNGGFPSSFRTRNLYLLLHFPLLITCLIFLSILDLISRIKFGQY